MSDSETASAEQKTKGRDPNNLLIHLEDLYVGYYRDLHIIRGINLAAEKGKLTAILGANGVGKSTLLKAIFGFLKPQSGKIMYGGQDIVGTPTHKLIDLGIAYIPQRTSIFPHMSVRENLMMGAYTYRRDRKRIRREIEQNYERFPPIRDKNNVLAGNLSGGMQRMVELGRTLMTSPQLILVDEPTAGLAKLLSREVYAMLTGLRDNEGITIILVDQEIREALKIADYVYVLELGRNRFEGPVEEFSDVEKAFWV